MTGSSLERSITVRNWFGNLISTPAVVIRPRSVDDIVEVLTDSARYPDPVRAVGSNHATSPCGVADGGTLTEMSSLDRILDIGPDYVTADGPSPKTNISTPCTTIFGSPTTTTVARATGPTSPVSATESSAIPAPCCLTRSMVG